MDDYAEIKCTNCRLAETEGEHFFLSDRQHLQLLFSIKEKWSPDGNEDRNAAILRWGEQSRIRMIELQMVLNGTSIPIGMCVACGAIVIVSTKEVVGDDMVTDYQRRLRAVGLDDFVAEYEAATAADMDVPDQLTPADDDAPAGNTSDGNEGAQS